MCTMPTGLQKSEMEHVHQDPLGREFNMSISEAAPYFRRSEELNSQPLSVVILSKTLRLTSRQRIHLRPIKRRSHQVEK